jgi:NAD(P)-dependent dehydrogenase (short-subunit alcohol dehydrogenase family)
MKEISGRTAVVTGAGGGIGRSIALALAAEGANVAVVDIEDSAAQAVAAEIRANGGKASGHGVDVSDLEAVRRLADAVYSEFGSVEILVNNAGVTLRPFRASWDTSYEDFQWVMNINFWGVLHGHHVFVPRMRETPGEKHIVNTSSIATLMPVPGHSAYSASKSAVDGFSHAAREELKTQGIGVSILHPGGVRTRIATSERLRPDQQQSEARGVKPWSDYAPPVIASEPNDEQADPDYASTPTEYITPNAVGQMVVDGIKRNMPHILTHPANIEPLRARLDATITGYPVQQSS